jgi:hypothetical protein
MYYTYSVAKLPSIISNITYKVRQETPSFYPELHLGTETYGISQQ